MLHIWARRKQNLELEVGEGGESQPLFMRKYRLNECCRIGCTLGSLGDSLAILSYVHANVAPSCGQQVSQPSFFKNK